MSSAASHSTAQAERPERSRNAKAQARHRAKRKAYIEQLEQTVTKLQIAMGYSTDQVSCLPPPLLKIRELEQENARLQKENDDLRRILTDSSGSRSLDSRRPAPYDIRSCERDYSIKRRKHGDGMYLSPGDTPPHGSDSTRPPPPLTIPQPLSHHYPSMGSNSLHASNASSSVFNIPGPTFQMPNTPSGSSATSSPPFSPAHLQAPIPSLDHRPHLSDHHSMPSYSQGGPHYSTVKVEDDHYAASNHSNHSSSMSTHYPSYNTPNHMEWHGGGSYSSERNLHR